MRPGTTQIGLQGVVIVRLILICCRYSVCICSSLPIGSLHHLELWALDLLRSDYSSDEAPTKAKRYAVDGVNRFQRLFHPALCGFNWTSGKNDQYERLGELKSERCVGMEVEDISKSIGSAVAHIRSLPHSHTLPYHPLSLDQALSTEICSVG